MISKSFVVQAFIALTILSSSLTSSANAGISPSRQFPFLSRNFVLVVTYELLLYLLTSDLGLARRDGSEQDNVPTATDDKRFRRFLFLGLVPREERC